MAMLHVHNVQIPVMCRKFKAWNEIWSHNVDISSAPKGWQVVDMTVTVLMATQGGWDAESKLVGFEGVPWLQGGNVMLDCTEVNVCMCVCVCVWGGGGGGGGGGG